MRTVVVVVALAGSLAIWAPPQAAAAEPISIETAELQSLDAASVARVLQWRGQSYAAGLDTYRIAQAVSPTGAFRLQLEPPGSATTIFKAVEPRTSIIAGAAVAAWLARNAKAISKPLSPIQENAARQLAIWSFTVPIDLNGTSVPDAAIRARAVELHAAALTANLDELGREPTGFQVVSFLAGGDLNDAVVQVQLRSTDREDTFNRAQAIDVRIGDDFATVCTGEQTFVDTGRLRRPGRLFTRLVASKRRPNPERPCVGATGGPKGTASIRLPRPSTRERLELQWNVDHRAGLTFAAPGGGFVTSDEVQIPFAAEQFVEPATIRDLSEVVERRVVSWTPKNGAAALGFWIIIAAAFVQLSNVVWIAMVALARSGWRRVRRANPTSEAVAEET